MDANILALGASSEGTRLGIKNLEYLIAGLGHKHYCAKVYAHDLIIKGYGPTKLQIKDDCTSRLLNYWILNGRFVRA